MQTTRCLLASGLAKRSLDEAKRFARLALSQDGIRAPQGPLPLVDFADADTIVACKTMSDADLGGFSTVSLAAVPQSATGPAHAHFSGSISTDLPRNRPQVQRSGFAGWRTKDRLGTIFGKNLWNLDPYTHLALRFKSDGRRYLVNVQTESVVPEDLHQHRLHSKTPGEWETVFINLGAFVRTNHGEVVEPQAEMLRERVRSIGISLTDRIPGDYDISISKIWASVLLNDQEM